MNTLCILLGGNLGDVKSNFKKAHLLLQETVGLVSKTSNIYKSEAWGYQSDSVFLNQVLIIETEKNPFGILSDTQAIEKTIGRKNKSENQVYSDRLIDIDILFFNNEIIETNQLTIPHPRLHLRNFTLSPLYEIIPEFKHPKLNKSIDWLNKHCEDKSVCTPI